MGAKPVDFNPFADTGQSSSLDALLNQQPAAQSAAQTAAPGPAGKPVDFNPFGETAAPAQDQTGASGQVNAFSGNALNALPIVGPAILGGAERLGAGIASLAKGTPYADELQRVQNKFTNATEQNPGLSTAGQITGGVLGTTAAGLAAPELMGIKAGMTVPAMLGYGAVSNGLMDAADAAIRGGDPVAAGLAGAALGAGGNAAGRAIGSGISSIADSVLNGPARKAAMAAVPTIEQRHDMGTKAYEAAKAMGTTLSPTDFSQKLGTIKQSIADRFGDTRATAMLGNAETKWAPNAAAAPDAMSSLTGVQPKPPAQKAPVTVQDFLDLRSDLGKIASKNADPMERYAAQVAQDELSAALPNTAVVSGDPKVAADLLKQGDMHWAAMRRGQIVAGRAELGDLNAATRDNTGSTGGPVKNAAKTLIRPNMEGGTYAARHGFNEPEIAQINRVARGAPLENFYQGLGSMMGGAALQGGTGAAIGAAEALREHQNPLTYGAIGFGIGLGAKKISSRMTHKQMDILSKMVLGRGLGVPVPPPIQPLPGMGLLLRGSVNPLLTNQ